MISLQVILGLAISGFIGLVFGFVILTFYNALGPPAALLRGDEALARQAFRRTLVLAAVVAMLGYVLYWGGRHWVKPRSSAASEEIVKRHSGGRGFLSNF